MKKRFLLTVMLMVVAISTISADEMMQTAMPDINLWVYVEPYERFEYDQSGDNYSRDCIEIYYNIIEIQNTDGDNVTIYYRTTFEPSEWFEYPSIGLVFQCYPGFGIDAYAQAEGKLPSDICHADGYFSNNTALVATVFYIDGLYYITHDPYNRNDVMFSSDNPFIGGVFNDNYNITSNYSGKVVIPNQIFWVNQYYDVTTIDRRAFAQSDVTSVVIPNSITKIDDEAFFECSSLASITIHAITPPTTNNIFDPESDSYALVTLFVPESSLETYRADWVWGQFTHIVPFIGAGPGDINGDGVIAINDVSNLIDQLLGEEELPAYADVNGDGAVNIKDITALIDQLLGGN